jgi:phosphoribosylformimino-5-aminoimidazole carboxamide ribotide isomerase
MTKFRPCIDLHDVKVKQIVGGTLRDNSHSDSTEATEGPTENFIADQSAEWFARKYRADGLIGGHVIKLGPGNEAVAKAALAAFPEGLQIGGGITDSNAATWLESGASHVIVTSWLFDDSARFQPKRLERLASEIGGDKIVVDLSCKKTPRGWTVAMNRWQTLTDVIIDDSTLDVLSDHCAEFLIHAADVEGLCRGIDADLVRMMGQWGKIPMTYAGGVAHMNDVELVASASNNKVDLTVGSSLDLFGGTGVSYDELVSWSLRQ